MNTKSDNDKLQFFSESVKEKMQIEINRVSLLYKAERISGIKGHEMLHEATKDINTLFWQVSAMIAHEHNRINFLRKVKRSVSDPLNTKQYFSKPTLEAIDNFVTTSKLYRIGVYPFEMLRKAGRLTKRLIRIDSIILRQDINELVRKAKGYTPQPEPEQEPEEMQTEVRFDEMVVKKVSSHDDLS